jgi:putative DNA-invertase from lambdoid prophage Rac
MSVYGYYRVLDRQADQGASLADQQRRISARADEHGWTIDEMFVEECVSGSTPFAERPVGGKLTQRLRTGYVVIVAKFDRLSRSARGALKTITHFGQRDVHVFALDMGGKIAKPRGVSKLIATLLAAVAEFERNVRD